MNFKTFCIDSSQMEYREFFDSNGLFEKFYEIRNPQNKACMAIPDGGVDVQCLWNKQGLKIQVAGSFMQGGGSQVSNYEVCFGGRLKRGVVPKCLQGYMQDIIDTRFPLDFFLNVELFTQVISSDHNIETKAEYL